MLAAAVNDDKKSRFGHLCFLRLRWCPCRGFKVVALFYVGISPIVSWWFARGREEENLEHISFCTVDLRALFSIVCIFFFLLFVTVWFSFSWRNISGSDDGCPQRPNGEALWESAGPGHTNFYDRWWWIELNVAININPAMMDDHRASLELPLP